MSWNLKGRAAIAALDPPTRHRILNSQTMTRCTNKPLLWVLEELCNLRSLGGLAGPLHAADYFMCLVARLLQICPAPAIVRVMLEQDVHKYMRAAALVLIRLIGHVEMQREALRVGWDDYRKLCLYGSEPAQEWASSTAAHGAATTASSPSSSTTAGEVVGNKNTLTASLLSLQHKRPRAEAGVEGNEMEADHAPQPPRYWLVRVDEFTDYLFGTAPLTAESGVSASPSRTLPAHVFMGIQFPALLM